MTRVRRLRALPLTAVIALAGCGGGGGSGGAPVVPQPPLNQAPTAAFTATPTSGIAPLTVEFDGSGSSDSDGTVARYTWTFGDTATAAGPVVSHTFTASRDGARYTVRLTVEDDDGASNSRIEEVRVAPPQRGPYTLSGTVQILPSSAIDSDVNDVGTTPESNNACEAQIAQPLSNPVTLGGYLTRPGAGADGNLKAVGDITDFFRVSLEGNETLLLTVGEPAGDAILSMQLYDEACAPIDGALVSGVAESAALTAPRPGTFYVEVAIVEGATNYVLNLGQAGPTTAGSVPRLSDDFIPGEIVVMTPDTVGLPQGYATVARGGDIRLVSVKDLVRERRTVQRVPGLRGGAGLSVRTIDKYETLAAIARLKQRVAARNIEPNYVRHPSRTPNDTYYAYQWHYTNVNLPLAWDITTGSDQVIVAVIDTGILPNHPDIAGQLVAGYDFISDPARARDGDGMDSDPTDPGDLAYGVSSSFHGTHVAGTVAAQSDDGEGVAGVAWNARIMPLRVLGRDGGTSYDVMQAMLYAARLPNGSGRLPPRRADVINLSLGSSGSSSSEQLIVNDVIDEDVIIVAAAGNDSTTQRFYPAAYTGVVAVAATTISNSRAPYSNSGDWVDVAAPGGYTRTDLNGDGISDGVLSTVADDSGGGIQYGYTTLNGTSMAAPHVAGIVALMKDIHPTLTPAQFDQALGEGLLTQDLGIAGLGHGLIDAHKAVIEAFDLANAEPPGPILAGSPTSVDFGVLGTTVDVVVRNAGTGTLNVTSVQSSEPWLTVEQFATDANGLGTYRLTADRDLIAEGIYSAHVTFASDVPGSSTLVVSAVMQKISGDPTADAGRHYIIVWHPATEITVGGRVGILDNGAYTFSIPSLGPGDYQVWAGTDSDNDGYLCDGGEACGAYQVLETPEVLTVNGSRTGLNFVSGFRVNLSNPTAAASGLPAGGIRIPRAVAVEQ